MAQLHQERIIPQGRVLVETESLFVQLPDGTASALIFPQTVTNRLRLSITPACRRRHVLRKVGAIEMRKFAFKWAGSQSLKSMLLVPFYKVSMQLHVADPALPTVMTFWREDGSWLEVYSVMRDIAERSEVGILTFVMVSSEPKDQEVVVDMERHSFVPVVVEKLVIRDEDVRAQSGVRLISDQGKVITVASNAFPCTLAVEGVRDEVQALLSQRYSNKISWLASPGGFGPSTASISS